ncbi:MAG: D-cysteine desulfhydrase [Defluviitaleaceae bacterium]|nr:D-cysteine desulfhydrase [Defluviitaleaceae bacterium]
MNLSRFPRRRYTPGPTPVEKLEALSKALGGPNIYIKRDDLLGLAGGGNKTRKLEFLMGDAITKGADTVITCGAVQSNHCRLTLAACIKEGLKCQMVLEQRVPGSYSKDASGNNFLFELMGVEATHVVDGGADLLGKMTEIAEELRKQGRKPYIIPGGGSNEVGALGYVACAQELVTQLFEMDLKIDNIVLTSGSTGTHAGMLTGMFGVNGQIPITGIGINRRNDRQIPAVFDLVSRTSAKLGLANPPKLEDVTVFEDYIGDGYSRPTPGMVEAVKTFATTEAILLDPVYTGKTADGLISLVKKGYFKDSENILFLHTGGSPALYHYKADILP